MTTNHRVRILAGLAALALALTAGCGDASGESSSMTSGPPAAQAAGGSTSPAKPWKVVRGPILYQYGGPTLEAEPKVSYILYFATAGDFLLTPSDKPVPATQRDNFGTIRIPELNLVPYPHDPVKLSRKAHDGQVCWQVSLVLDEGDRREMTGIPVKPEGATFTTKLRLHGGPTQKLPATVVVPDPSKAYSLPSSLGCGEAIGGSSWK